MGADRGRARINLDDIEAIAVDEVHWSRRQGFLTLVYQIDQERRRLIWIGQHRRSRRAPVLRLVRAQVHPPAFGSSAATCGSRTSRWSPRCHPRPSTSSTGSASPPISERRSISPRTVLAYLLSDNFEFFWTNQSPFWAGRFLDL